MGKILNCAICDVPCPHDRHRFVDDSHGVGGAPSKITEQYCDEHCPRCDTEKLNGK